MRNPQNFLAKQERKDHQKKLEYIQHVQRNFEAERNRLLGGDQAQDIARENDVEDIDPSGSVANAKKAMLAELEKRRLRLLDKRLRRSMAHVREKALEQIDALANLELVEINSDSDASDCKLEDREIEIDNFILGRMTGYSQ